MIQENNKSGFTMLELSIVLVIIGLIVGGVLAGQNLIASAEIRAAAKEAEAFRSGYITFKDKFDCVPGDCRNATEFLDDATNGDGDSLISCGGASSSCHSTVEEQEGVFDHLSRTGMIKSGKYANDEAMSARIGSCQFFAFENRRGDNELYGAGTGNYLWIQLNLKTGPWFDNCLTPTEAKNLDKKIDDSFAGSGRMYGYEKLSSDNNECADQPNTQGDKGRVKYYVKKEEIGCVVALQLD